MQIISCDRQPQDILDAFRSGAEHDKPVEAKRDAGAVRHAVAKGGDEIRVDGIMFAIQFFFCIHIGFEAALLFTGVGQFKERIRKFDAADVKLEPFGEVRAVDLWPRERRLRYRIISDQKSGGFCQDAARSSRP